ncbi:MAG: hypothetical protein IT361_09150 [Gemmatimonadaceae bacterium]|nr:hypothetical protein [Gemmatimonadaceae bacterium]
MKTRAFLAAATAAALWAFPIAGAAQPTTSQQPESLARLAGNDSLIIGGRIIPVGATVDGPVVVAGGNLEVRGTVRGTALAIAGDVLVKAGGRVTGDAIAAFGDVLNEGTVDGKVKPLTGTFGASLRTLMRGNDAEPHPNRSPLNLAVGWFTVMMLIGLGVLVFASPYLDGVVDVLGQSFWRSFLTGVVGELGVLPVILLICVGLAITVIGALLIPFAVVALVLAVAGLATLGFVAVARLTGDGIGGRTSDRLSARGSSLRGVVVGLALYMGLWLLAAALNQIPVAGTVLRLLALVVTFVAATAGFGAALLSRGGTRRDAAVTVAPAPASDAGWQTPTPVAGVAAARRSRAKVGS